MEYLSRRLAVLGYFIPELWDLQELDDADEDRRASLLNPRISRTRTRGATPTTSLLDEEPHESRVEICVAGRREFVTRMREVRPISPAKIADCMNQIVLISAGVQNGAKVWKVARAYDLAAREAKSEEADRKRYIAYGRRGACVTRFSVLARPFSLTELRTQDQDEACKIGLELLRVRVFALLSASRRLTESSQLYWSLVHEHRGQQGRAPHGRR